MNGYKKLINQSVGCSIASNAFFSVLPMCLDGITKLKVLIVNQVNIGDKIELEEELFS